MLLGHLRQRLRKIYHGVAAIFGAYQPHGKVTNCFPKTCCLWAGWGLYRLGVGCADCQRGMLLAEVGSEVLGNRSVSFRQVLFEKA